MDREAISTVDRVRHGGADDRDVLDFSTTVNPERPEGICRIYESALCSARQYPPDDYCEYRIAAGEHVGCEPRDVVPTAGGLAAVRLATSVCVAPGDDVLLPAPASGEFAREVRLQGGEPSFVPHDELLERDPEGHAMALLSNPNDPTGRPAEADRLLAFADRCRAAGTTLVVEESLLGFTERPSMAGHPGVVAVRTLGKLFGLPGLRAGFAAATGELGRTLEAARPTWNLGTPAAHVGAYCLGREGFVEHTRRRVRLERERMAAELATRFEVRPSAGPFLLCDVGPDGVPAVLAEARRRGIVLRDARTFRGLDRHVRVAVRRPAENDRLLAALLDG